MTTEDAISIAESHHASEMLVGRANTTLRCRIVTALEVVLQHSMMIHFDPLVSRLSERLLFVETFIIRHNQEPGNQLHQFNQQKVDQMKNELSSLQVETHWLPRLSTVTKGRYFYPSSSNDIDIDQDTTWFSYKDILNLTQLLYDQYWLPISFLLQYLVMSTTLVLKDVYQELQLAVATFFRRQRECHSGHVDNVLIYQMRGHNFWRERMSVLNDIIYSLTIVSRLMETELIQLSKHVGPGWGWETRCAKWFPFSQFEHHLFSYDKPTFSRQLTVQCLERFQHRLLEEVMVRSDDRLVVLQCVTLEELKRALKCFGYTLMQATINLNNPMLQSVQSSVRNRSVAFNDYQREICKHSKALLDLVDDWRNKIHTTWIVERSNVSLDWNAMLTKESIIGPEANLPCLRRLAMDYHDASCLVAAAQSKCIVIKPIVPKLYVSLRELVKLQHIFYFGYCTFQRLFTDQHTSDYQCADLLFKSLLQQLQNAIKQVETARLIENQPHCEIDPISVVSDMRRDLQLFLSETFADIARIYLRSKCFCSRQPMIVQSMRWLVADVDWEFKLQELALKEKRYESAMEVLRWQQELLKFAIDEDIYMEMSILLTNTRYWHSYFYPLIGFFGYCHTLQNQNEYHKNCYNEEENGNTLKTAKIQINRLSLAATIDVQYGCDTILDAKRGSWCMLLACKANQCLEKADNIWREGCNQMHERIFVHSIMASLFRYLLIELPEQLNGKLEHHEENFLFCKSLVEQAENAYQEWIQRSIDYPTSEITCGLQKCRMLHLILGICTQALFQEKSHFKNSNATEEDLSSIYFFKHMEENVAIWSMTKVTLLELQAEWEYLSSMQHDERRQEIYTTMEECLPWIEQALEIAILEFELRDYLPRINRRYCGEDLHNKLFGYRLSLFKWVLKQVLFKPQTQRKVMIASCDGFILACNNTNFTFDSMQFKLVKLIRSFLRSEDFSIVLSVNLCIHRIIETAFQRAFSWNRLHLNKIGKEVVQDIYHIILEH